MCLVLRAAAVVIARLVYGVALIDALTVRFSAGELPLAIALGGVAGLAAAFSLGNAWRAGLYGGGATLLLSARSCWADAKWFDVSPLFSNATFWSSLVFWVLIGTCTAMMLAVCYRFSDERRRARQGRPDTHGSGAPPENVDRAEVETKPVLLSTHD